jgi:tRNA nucleotidyltransferase (CCA-adding enzyme)
MHIILTHEQADFDALASMLGAHLLDENAIPVLPRRMNRNVRAFVALYGAELPYIEQRDLPSQPITRVTLVDTQSIISVKGLSAKTQVHVIDHHPRRADLPASWTVSIEEAGAITTCLVQELQERDHLLTSVQATMLLLGIYEDTGSLTYTRTTPHDLTAAAFLLQHGANLQIAGDFLNHPLSLKQQALLEQLRSDAVTHAIHGHKIVIACGDATEVEEELSSIAQKLRDSLEPDALFLLVNIRGGMQLIARSTNERVDVAQISAHFGGGGHERAAAGLIKDRQLVEVCAELLEVLPRYIRPAITVSQIMSKDPQLLPPETPVEEAARRMQRYGYEGYPVVKLKPNGEAEVLGLLTRRAVDRAVSHKLKVSAASLMNAGAHSVLPTDSIEQLQRLMNETGWGQIPVISPDNQRIIGIVTRTDLLKILTPEAHLPERMNLADRLEKVLPAARLALLHAVAQMARQQRAALFVVGGFVRDLLLERPSLDFDLVVEGDAIELAKALARQYGGRVTSHNRFGTAKWLIAPIRQALAQQLASPAAEKAAPEFAEVASPSLSPTQRAAPASAIDPADLPDSLDLISARTEFYSHPTALPTVERGSIKLDLHRRDFTINTLAMRLDGNHYGELHDYWGGLSDLRLRLVRVLHSLSFVDDPTRMLRAVRFEQRFHFQIETRTLELLQEARPLMDRLTGDRLRHELNHILKERQTSAMLSRLDELGLLSAIHKSLRWDDWLSQRFLLLKSRQPEPYWQLDPDLNGDPFIQTLAYCLWMIRLSEAEVRSICERLRISQSLAEVILEAGKLNQELPTLVEASPSRIVQRLDHLKPLVIYAAYLAVEDQPLLADCLRRYAQHWKQIRPFTTGDDLRARGLSPGPRYKQILEALRAAWLDGRITTAAEEHSLLEELLQPASTPRAENQPG